MKFNKKVMLATAALNECGFNLVSFQSPKGDDNGSMLFRHCVYNKNNGTHGEILASMNEFGPYYRIVIYGSVYGISIIYVPNELNVSNNTTLDDSRCYAHLVKDIAVSRDEFVNAVNEARESTAFVNVDKVVYAVEQHGAAKRVTIIGYIHCNVRGGYIKVTNAVGRSLELKRGTTACELGEFCKNWRDEARHENTVVSISDMIKFYNHPVLGIEEVNAETEVGVYVDDVAMTIR